MNIALFGGSFNPPHNGHAAVAKVLSNSPDFDEVWIVPSFQHPFGKEMASFEDRLTLCRLAFERLSPRVKVSNVEKEMALQKSYTIDTIRHLQKKYPQDKFFLIMGSDLLRETGEWKEFEGIKKLVEIYPISRAGYEESKFPNLSSTQIREAVAKGEDIRSLVPEAVRKYIVEKGLYKFPL